MFILYETLITYNILNSCTHKVFDYLSKNIFKLKAQSQILFILLLKVIL